MADANVTLVIPGRNCAATIRPCLDSVVSMLADETSPLGEIIFVNDGSTDETPTIVDGYPVTRLDGEGRGPAAARNLGWRAAAHDLVWFIDSDCVSAPDALDRLVPHLDDPKVGGVSGSYTNLLPDSLLACLIHEEIIERHSRMPVRVDYLATFNVLYRRSILDEVGGLDERFRTAEDADLSFRVMAAGYDLHFEIASRVGHHHPTGWLPYLRTQRQHGYWRVRLYRRHADRAHGDSYSNVLDHLQPLLAMLLLVAPVLLLVPGGRWGLMVVGGLAALAPVPMTLRLLRRRRQPKYAAFWWMSLIRAFWRGVGLTYGVLSLPFDHTTRSGQTAP